MNQIIIKLSFDPQTGGFTMEGPDMSQQRMVWDYMLAQAQRQLTKACNDADSESRIVRPQMGVVG